jgi:hypothetical protein
MHECVSIINVNGQKDKKKGSNPRLLVVQLKKLISLLDVDIFHIDKENDLK